MLDLLAALLLALFAWRLWRRDRRRLRIGVAGVLAVWFALAAVAEVLTYVSPAFAWGFAVVGGLLPLLVLLLAGFLIANGAVVLRREGAGILHRLSLAAGLALVVVPVLVVWFARIAVDPSTGPVLRGLAVGLCVLAVLLSAYAGVFFVVVLALGWAYRRSTRHATASSIIVLGSGLIGARVPPMLAARLDRGAEVFVRSEAAGLRPVLVPSGGKGDDELRAEGDAMRDYLLLEEGLPADRILPETRSTNTEENLRFSMEIIERETGAGRAAAGRTVVATSAYHVLRSALLARRLGFDADVTGAPVAAYFVPSATLREFVAIALLHPRLQVGVVAASLVVAIVAGVAAAVAL